LKLSKKIVNELLPYQCHVKLTRKMDFSLGLSNRAELANSLNADLFVSVHINAGGGTGFESFIHKNAPELTRQHQNIVHGRVVSYLQGYQLTDRGQKRADFAVLRLTKMPSILLENLFLDRGTDIVFLNSEPFLAGLSNTIAEGISATLDIPLRENPWDPDWEIAQLQTDRIINTPRLPEANVSWGELATVLNRVREVPPPSTVNWDPVGEIALLMRDKILNTAREATSIALWGEFATVLNRLRKRAVNTDSWNPQAEIEALIADRLLMSTRNPGDSLSWGEFATVINRYRGTGG